MTPTMSLAGWNINPRNNFDVNEFAPHHARLQPAICVVSHEAPVITRLELDSPNTTYIYRDSPPGRGTDDDVHQHAQAADYVRYLHAKAPERAALYLGNEPNSIYDAALWSLEALTACNEVGRTGVFMNLSFGRPEPEHWAENRPLSQLVERISGTRHILGLHEYCGPGKLGEGYWIARCRDVNRRAEALGIQPPKVAITELGVLKFADELHQGLDPFKGWTLAGISAEAMMAQLVLIYDTYAALGNVIGTALFCAGDWGHENSCRADKDSTVKREMEAYVNPVTITRPAQRPDEATTGIVTTVKATKDASGANVRSLPMASGEILGHVKAGDRVTVFPQTWRAGGQWYWVWIEKLGGVNGWVADVATFEADDANRKKTGPLPPVVLPEPIPEPEPEPEEPPVEPEPEDVTLEEARQLSTLYAEVAARMVTMSGIYAAIAERAGAEIKASATPSVPC